MPSDTNDVRPRGLTRDAAPVMPAAEVARGHHGGAGRGAAAGTAWSTWYDGLHRSAGDRKRHDRIVRAKHFADGRFAGPVPLAAMATVAGLSKYHFVRAFRDIFRRTPHRYVIHRRIDRARELLERTDLSVTAIGYEVGFESLGSFMNRFRAIVGESPGRYRRRFSRRGPVDRRPIPACLYEAFSNGS